MIEIKGIEKSFDDNHVLKNVSFTFEKGKQISLLVKVDQGKQHF